MPSPTTSGTIVAFTASTDNTVAALVNDQHSRWGATSRQPLTFSFPGYGAAWVNNYSLYLVEEPSYGFAPMSSAQKAIARNALVLWGEVANIYLSEVTETQSTVGDVRIAFSGAVHQNEGNNTWGYTYSLSAGWPESGDVWIDASHGTSSFAPGSYDFFGLLHEIGHALGFKHPFDGAMSLPAATDTNQYTVMAYTDSPNYPTGVYAQTPMVYDIRAIQYLYGANMTTRTGNDTYLFSPASVTVKAIWDAGGTDTFDASGFNEAVALDLRDGHYSSVGMTENIGIAYGVTIENAVGGAGSDTLTGNDGSNRLDGGAGNDTISGGAGNDSITAGTGNDSVSGGDGNDTIVMGANLDGNDTIAGGAGADTISVNAGTTDAAFINVTGIEAVALVTTGALTLGAREMAASITTLTGAAAASETAAGDIITVGLSFSGPLTYNPGVGKVSFDASASTASMTVAGVSSTLTGADTINGGSGTGDMLSIDASASALPDSAFTNVTNVEVLKSSAVAMGIVLDARAMAAGIATLVGATAASETAAGDVVTVGPGFSGALTYSLGAGKVSFDASGSTASISVAGGASTFTSGDIIKGGSGAGDRLNLMADGGTGAVLANVSGFETVNVLASGANSARITLGADGVIAPGRTFELNASALTNTLAALAYDGSAVTTASKAQSVTGGAGNDTLIGGAGADTLIGGAGGDSILGGAGNDSITAGAGDDSISGGAGFDTAVYRGAVAGYAIRKAGSGFTVSNPSGSDGNDVLTDTEQLTFSGGVMRLDVGGVPGEAYRIYQAAFNRQPDTGGLKYWVGQMDAGMDLVQVSARFIDSPEFGSLYGEVPSNANFVYSLYTNVLHRAPEAIGYSWWVGELDSGNRARDKVLADFSESHENQINIVGVIQDGIWLG